jgi:hypothetical protein
VINDDRDRPSQSVARRSSEVEHPTGDQVRPRELQRVFAWLALAVSH